MDLSEAKWEHPGGKLIEAGPRSLTNEELVAILIGTGYKGRPAQKIAYELMGMVSSLSGIMGRRLYDMARITGLGDAKVTRIAAAYEIMSGLVKILENE